MQRKIFKFKIISKKDNCILSLDYTNLTNEIIRSITKNPIKIEPNEKCKLLFVGKIAGLHWKMSIICRACSNRL